MQSVEGTTLGRYHLRNLIGHGGMAKVYLADDEVLHREVAVKIVHHSQRDELARLQREAETAGSLIHEHILPVFDYGQENSWHYLVMPYISSGTLADRLNTRGPLNLTEAGVVLKQVASALQYAHERGILHRDIKPSNIMLLNDSYVYLADFGIARLVEQGNELTQTGTIIGTPEYMAPEMLDQPASQSSDIYALGVVLYYMLAGHLPFTAPNAIALFQKHLYDAPPSLSALDPTIPQPVEEVVSYALAKDPQQRFQTPLALANAYHQAVQIPPTPLPQTNPTFYADTTIAVPVVHSPVPSQTIARSAISLSTRSRRNATLLVLAGSVLILSLLSVLATLLPGIHANQQTVVQAVATASAISTPTPDLTAEPAITCTVHDPAAILDRNQICAAAQNLKFSLEVNVKGNGSEGDSDANGLPQTSLAPDPHTIVIDITVGQKHGHNRTSVSITGGSAVPLSDTQYRAAVNAFYQTLNHSDYTTATESVIQALINDGA